MMELYISFNGQKYYMAKDKDLTKVTIITLLGLSILVFSLFWLKGYKFYNQEKIKVSFEDVSGLEEGAIVRWSGLRVGVVESIDPVIKSEEKTNKAENKKNAPLNKDNEDLKATAEVKIVEDLKTKISVTTEKNELEKLNKDLEISKRKLELHVKQGITREEQKLKEEKSHVVVTLVITEKDVPFGPLSTVSIVPTGFIGEQYVEISPLVNESFQGIDYKPMFISKEPLRFERLMKANIESSEAFRDAITKINKLVKDDDIKLLISTVKDVSHVVKNVNTLIDNAGVLIGTTSEKLDQLATSSNQLSKSVVQVSDNLNKIIGDDEITNNVKSTTQSLNIITTEVAKLFDEEGLAKDIKDISNSAKSTSVELSSFIKDLRKTQEELELTKTVSNLNALSTKLDTLATEVNTVVADKEFQKDIKLTAKQSRETSENLQKASKKLTKRFLLFRLLF
jgi:ABC-type transporter Mla subunit MlaD